MRLVDGALVHSVADLNAYSECVHLTALERAAASGHALRPALEDGTAELLAKKGREHEKRYLERLRSEYGDRLRDFDDDHPSTRAGYAAAEAAAVAAMAAGVDVLYQPTFFDGTFAGRPDFLIKTPRPSARWVWSYEVVDTKLALSPKPYFMVQLCSYSEHVERVQGTMPEEAATVLGTGEMRRFRTADFSAYYRRLKASYLESVARGDDVYPFECSHCDRCIWQKTCDRKRDEDDHLSIVAGIRRDQIRKLERAGIATLAALAESPAEPPPRTMNAETFASLRAQAAEQHRFRSALEPRGHSYTFRPPSDEHCGFARLPPPAPGDVFFDMEGDPMYRADRGLEYLFGAYVPDEDRYHAFWGRDPIEERSAFEAFVDFVVERQKTFPDLHVYHYAPYETSALKRLMGRFASREDVIDAFLRAGTFVDLYPVVRQSVWISQPSYSIKKVEALYGFERHTQTRHGDDSIVMFESWLESRDPAVLEDIRAYNEDDCRSTWALREWLVRLRAERNLAFDPPIPWRASQPPQIEVTPRTELETALLQNVTPPDSLRELRRRCEDDRARWLLGNLVQYHRREAKPAWWEHYHRIDHPDELIETDRKSLGGLELCTDVEPYKLTARDRNSVYTYRFPEQEHDLGTKPIDPATNKGAGDVIEIDDSSRTLRIKLAGAIDPPRLRALVPETPLSDRPKREAIEAIANAYLEGTLERDRPALASMLLARRPRMRGRAAGERVQPDVVTACTVSAIVAALDGSHLVVQGPPGSGKSTTGASVIVDLLAARKRVALAARSHKALHNLLHKIEDVAARRGVAFSGAHKSTASNDDSVYRSRRASAYVVDTPSAADLARYELVSATTFAWADERHRGAFDVVIVDEAGQISLADALITALVARDVVLLGDPQQLPQVSQGSHPVGADQSILEHLLAGAATIPADRGIFLDTSYRMHPAIDRFVSNAFYESRLAADPLNARNAIVLHGATLAGPSYVPVVHEGNARRSNEEAECIAAEIAQVLAAGRVTVRDGAPRPLHAADILVVAPFNVQRRRITEALGRRGLDGVNVGTVDKFQGLEAPLVFYSLTTSSAELAPRGLEFLLSLNRLNVAVSRAQVQSVVVCSPQLLTAKAGTVEHMHLLNVLCAYAEEAARSRYADLPLLAGPRAADFAAVPDARSA